MSRRDQEFNIAPGFNMSAVFMFPGIDSVPVSGFTIQGSPAVLFLPFVGIFWSLVSLLFAGVKYGMSSDRIFGVRQSASGMPEGVVSPAVIYICPSTAPGCMRRSFASAALRVFGS